MLLDPSVDQKALFRDWVEKRYGKEAAPYVVSALSRTFDIVNKSYFALGFWYTNHSFLNSYNDTRDSFWLWSSAKWDKRQKTLERALLNPTPLILNKVIAEKDEAVRLAELSVGDIERAKPYLSSRDYAKLKDLMEREKAMAEVWREHARTFFAIEIAQKAATPENKARVLENAEKLKVVAEKNRRHLINMAADYARPNDETNLKEINGLIEKAREND
jgi:hypothetical protein